MIDTRMVEYVIAIAEEHSLNKAAEKLYITQPALSQSLKKLESELGTQLFTRENNGMNITDAGRIYINGGRSVMQIKQQLMAKLSDMEFSTSHHIRFGVATSHALMSVPGFHKDYPGIELISKRCNSIEAKEELIMGRLDLAVLLTSSLHHSVLEYLPLSENQVLLAVPKSHPVLSQAFPFANGYECFKDDYFIMSSRDSFSREAEEKALIQMGIEPHVLCEITNVETKRYMLNKGLGIAFLPGYTVRNDDSFVTFSLKPPISFYVVAAYPKNNLLTDPMKALLKRLLEAFDTSV
jgi:DNA-binding transcriptional LysR family regulator